MKYKTKLLIFLGSILWSLTMVKSGILYDYGMGFWGPNGHDGIWHIALAESLANGTWEMPVFAGEQIQNYHIGFDLLLAVLHKITFIPIVTLYFQILPPLFALLIGYFAYKFVYEWTHSEAKAWWSTFFIYFGGSWGWLVSYFKDGTFSGESMFWAQQSISTLINPPFALSLVTLFAGLYLLVSDFHERSNKHLVLVSFLFGILIQVKVYAGLLALSGLLTAGFWRMFSRKGISLIKIFLGAFLISLFIFSPSSGDVGGAIEFRPFWFLEAMMSYPDRLGWPKYAEAMVNYKLGGVWLKGISAYLIAFLIFWFGNLGSRGVKEILFLKWLKNYRELDSIQVFLLIVITAGIIVPTFFVQTGTPWNTIQFMYYSLMFSGILAGIAIGTYLDENKIKMNHRRYGILIYHTQRFVFPALIILLTVPTTFATLGYHYLPSRPPSKISVAELEALEFLKEQPDGTVLTQPFDPQKAQDAVDNPPRPLYLYESTAYVSAMTGKKVFLEDQVNLEITGYEWKERRDLIEENFNEIDTIFVYDNEISYIYVVKDLGVLTTNFESVFENDEIIIYVVN